MTNLVPGALAINFSSDIFIKRKGKHYEQMAINGRCRRSWRTDRICRHELDAVRSPFLSISLCSNG